VVAERRVMARLKEHRLHELLSTGRPLAAFGEFLELQEDVRAELGAWGLSVTPLRAAHTEVAFGLLVECDGTPVLGWTVRGGRAGGGVASREAWARSQLRCFCFACRSAPYGLVRSPRPSLAFPTSRLPPPKPTQSDSGYDEALLARLAAAPVVLVDARAAGTPEHAGFDQVAAAATAGPLRGRAVYVYGYGSAAEAPNPRTALTLCAAAKVLRPGDVVHLGPPAEAVAVEPAKGGQQPAAVALEALSGALAGAR
jgi:hypothetical protein